MTIWFDVDDLIAFHRDTPTPTGIQRLSFETCRAMFTLAGASDEIKFCRQSANRLGFRAISFPALEGFIHRAAQAMPPSPIALPQDHPRPLVPRGALRLRQRLRSLPPEFHRPLAALRLSGKIAGQAARDLWRACLHPALRAPGWDGVTSADDCDLGGSEIAFAPGDWLVCLGAGWNTPYAPSLLHGLRAQKARFALLVYDLIPELFPEWCRSSVVEDFSHWLRNIVPQADRVFAISGHTAQDLAACMARLGLHTPPALVLPVGGNLVMATPSRPSRPYILVVGTLEIRKNHAALLRVWRALLRNPPPGGVPELVIAGKPGWLATDVIQQLHDTDGFAGHIRVVAAPSAPALQALYAGCLFTVFPAFYEGWGLPVTESLCFGKTVAASRNAAIPEAGGAFCVYFDPDDTNEMHRVIRGLIESPARRAALEALIAEHYRPPAWADTATALLDALNPVPAQRVAQLVVAEPE
ncbi:MAG: glycosyltransferase family 1 protein [Acidocella sp.]|nr:glycosyltransferase family 1 protein [Acidocella sp.]